MGIVRQRQLLGHLEASAELSAEGDMNGIARNSILAVLAAMTVAACVPDDVLNTKLTDVSSAPGNADTVDARLSTWVGASVDDLIFRWGDPADKTNLPGGGIVLTYADQQTTRSTDLSGVGRMMGMTYSQADLLKTQGGSQYQCVVAFRVSRQGIVSDATIVKRDSRAFGNVCDGLIKANARPVASVQSPATVSAQEVAVSADTVRSIQEALNAKGYDVGATDGVMGPRTRAAIMSFQKRDGLPADGKPSAALLKRLTS